MGSKQEDIKYLSVGVQECDIIVVVVVMRWGLNRRRTLLSVKVPEFLITIIIVIVVVVKRWSVKRGATLVFVGVQESVVIIIVVVKR